MASASLKTYWVDKTRTVIVRESSERKQRLMGTPVTSSILLAFSVVKVNQPVPDTLFAFVPPEGAREVEAFGPPGMPRRSSQINREAPEAIFRNLDGQSVSLKTYRGKVIFLVYWASWSNPSREEMALVEKLYREHKDKGLVLLAVDYGEDASVVKSYLEKNETAATVLLDPDRQIARLFDISSVPNAIFISREGKIVAIESGFGPRTEEHLRAALKDSGLN
jgi:peroxiredoxin